MENKEVIKVNALDLKSFNENRFNPKAVYESDEIKVILAYFKQGQFIPVHTPGVDVVLYILDGEAQVAQRFGGIRRPAAGNLHGFNTFIKFIKPKKMKVGHRKNSGSYHSEKRRD